MDLDIFRIVRGLSRSARMYKVVYTVVEVGKPKSVDGGLMHVSGPCKMYKVGDKMTVVGNPGQLVMHERAQTVKQALLNLGKIHQ